MLPEEIIGSLKSLTQKHGFKISEIERDCLVPKNSLASVITGTRSFPMKHKERLQEYCKAKEIAILLGSSPTEKLDGKQWVGQIKAFCAKKGFPPSELIEKFEELEAKLAERTGSFNLSDIHDLTSAFNKGQNKPDTAPQTGKSGKTTQKEEKGKEGAQRGLEIEYEGEPLSEDEVRQIAENAKKHKPKGEMPAGLSKADTLKWLRNNK